MSDHFPICDLRFDLETSPAKIEAQLTRYLRKLRWVALGHDPAEFDAAGDDGRWDDTMRVCRLSSRDGDRIRRRASALADLRLRASGMAHLGREARETLAGLKHGVHMERLASEHRADEIAAALHEEMPWMARATEIAWHAMRESVREGAPAVRLPPLLLDGPPGIGKSHWARQLAELVGMPSELIDAANEPAGFAVAGSQKGWSTAHPGRPVELILNKRVGNPVIVIDEVDKVGDVQSNKGVSFALSHALLPLLEPLSARTWNCPYYRVRFDMRWISWVLTSNNRRAVPAPLLSRCRVVEIPPLSGAHLAYFARREGTVRGLPADTVEALADILRGAERGWDLRAVLKLIDGVFAREALPLLH